MENKTREKLHDFLKKEFKSKALTETDDLIVLGLDNDMKIIRLIFFLEEKLNYTIPPNQVTQNNFKNLDTLIKFLDSL
jgi:acyl carrier protein